jgi:hypothetical protein
MVNTYKLGSQGEQIVLGLLDGAVLADTEENDYDIFWKATKIEVKTSGLKRNTAFVFTGLQEKRNDIIYVFVGIDEDIQYFWVKKSPVKTGFYGSIKEAIVANLLKGEVLKFK